MGNSTELPIVFSRHALDQMVERGAIESEVIQTIRDGERLPAKKNRTAYRRNMSYQGVWGGTVYTTKQLMAIVAEEDHQIVVVTVYVFYF